MYFRTNQSVNQHTILRFKGHHVPTVIVGNKSDLVDSREVSLELNNEIRRNKLNNSLYIETSAKCNTNVDALFFEILKQIALSGQQSKEAEHLTKAQRLMKQLSISSFSSLSNYNIISRKGKNKKLKEKKKEENNDVRRQWFEKGKAKLDQKCVIT